MLTDDELGGIRKPDPNSTHEIKVKLSYQQLQMLRYLKMRSNRTFSDVVQEALEQFFTDKVVASRSSREGDRSIVPAEA